MATILLIDDEASIRRTLKEILEFESQINFENPIKQIEIKLQIATFYVNLDDIGKARYINHQANKFINELSIKKSFLNISSQFNRIYSIG